MTADLVDFLRARLDDDERTAQAAVQGRWKLWGMQVLADPVGDSELRTAIPVADTRSDPPMPPRTWNAQHIARHDPARVLREVAAKRAIIDRAEVVDGHGPAVDHTRALDMQIGASHALRDTLRALAAVYVDHPAYRAEWA